MIACRFRFDELRATRVMTLDDLYDLTAPRWGVDQNGTVLAFNYDWEYKLWMLLGSHQLIKMRPHHIWGKNSAGAAANRQR